MKTDRVIYKKDLNLSVSGYADFKEAKLVEFKLAATYPEPEYRIRTRLRTRTNTWDVVVKVRHGVAA